jgi:hypothetical protein
LKSAVQAKKGVFKYWPNNLLLARLGKGRGMPPRDKSGGRLGEEREAVTGIGSGDGVAFWIGPRGRAWGQ